MHTNLVIVESPAKGKTIEKFLGKDYLVRSSYGHIRDLSKKKLGVEIENNYSPNYEVPADKKKVVGELKKLVKESKHVWLASDEDREGEAIAWHLCEVLGLDQDDVKRIVFHEITKDAITNAINNPRKIDLNLVNAQQARRVLDRLVGFELSPVLWKKVKPSLSAGRVQSVAVRLIVEREREINAFTAESYYKVSAIFTKTSSDTSVEFKAELPKGLTTKEETIQFLTNCMNSVFTVTDVAVKPSKKSPPPPFTTSTLQQEASRKLGFSVSQTMTIAQKLYESGQITYMRTDSVNLSDLALGTAKKEICKEYGDNYHQFRKFATKTKGAQEAHEAIRPTYIDNHTVQGSRSEKKLYELIWKRTIASQMADASLEKTTVKIDVSNDANDFVANGEVLKFDGFLKVYNESSDNGSDEVKGLLPALEEKEILNARKIVANQKYSHHPPRYTEASLVRKLEDLGIGRPSTYAPTISTIQARDYVVKEERSGTERSLEVITLTNDGPVVSTTTEITGAEKGKLFPTDIGTVVTDFLVEHFEGVLDYNFTAKVEKDFDEIALGEVEWQKMIHEFYGKFHKKVLDTLETSEKNKGERVLGDDPVSGKPVIVKIGRYGPIAQIGSNEDEEKPRFSSLKKGQSLETITLEEALVLFKLPRTIGEYEEQEVIVSEGRFGPYVKHGAKFFSLKKTDDPLTITLERAIELILEKRLADEQRVIKKWDEEPELFVLNGRYGPYISYKSKNYRLPKKDAEKDLSLEEVMTIVNTTESTSRGSSKKKKTKS